jgi:hypothetical protein
MLTDVAAATHTAALTAWPPGSAPSTTTTHFNLAARVDSSVRTSSGRNPIEVDVMRSNTTSR